MADCSEAAIDPTGKRALSIGAGGQHGNVWDLSNGKHLYSFEADFGLKVGCFSPDGTRIMTKNADGIYVRDASNGEVLQHITWARTKTRWNLGLVVYGPNGDLFVTEHNGFMVIADAETGKEARRFDPSGPVVDVCFSPDGFYIVTLGKKLQLWNAQTGELIREYGSHGSFTYSIAFSPDGKRLVSAGGASIRLWDTESGQELLSFSMNSLRGVGRYVSFRRDGSKILTTDGSFVKIFDAEGVQPRIHVDSN